VHPLLADSRRLAIYLLAWAPLALLLMSLLVGTGAFSWPQAAELVVPLALIYAFMCLSAWYICRYVPIGGPGVLYLLIAVTPAASIVSLIWSGAIAWGVALMAGLEAQYLRYRWLLFGAGVLLYYLAVAFHYVLMAIESSRQAEAREMEARILAREAELRALKAQINPHFLFNCLNSISALTSSDPGKAREMCVLLSDFLRSSLGVGDHDQIPLRDELALARSFLAIQGVRFADRLRLEEEIDPGLQAWPVPPLILQPLVENAVTHGVSTLVEGSSVRLEARRAESSLSLAVENTFDPEAPRRHRRGGVGLANVRKRLDARYGNHARVDVVVSGNRFRVELMVPPAAEEAR
jgi:two-component system sensor histidine kinase AlgZ